MQCPQFPVSVSPRLGTTLGLRAFRGAEPCTSYRRLTQIKIDNLASLIFAVCTVQRPSRQVRAQFGLASRFVGIKKTFHTWPLCPILLCFPFRMEMRDKKHYLRGGTCWSTIAEDISWSDGLPQPVGYDSKNVAMRRRPFRWPPQPKNQVPEREWPG